MDPPPARPPAAADDLAPGATVGRFRLDRALHRGEGGAVFAARDLSLGRAVAFRLVRTGAAGEAEVRAAFEALAALHHQVIAPLYDTGWCPQGPYLVEALVSGEPLRERLARGPLPPAEALRVALEVAGALAHAHAQGGLHLGLEPGNVLMAPDGQVTLVGFGLAHALGRPRAAGGGPAFAAPEQRAGGGDARADVYALGALLAALLGGPEGAPAPLDGALAQLTAPAPGDRPADGAAVLALLSPLVTPVRGLSGQPAPPPRRRSRRRRWLALAAGLLALAAAGAGLWGAARPPARPRVAVLPFEDLSGGGQAYFAEGLSEEVLEALAHNPGLHVADRASVAGFKGRHEDLRAIGRALEVDAVLEGSLRRDGTRLRVTAQLIKAGDGFHLWSQSFDRELAGVFAVQDEIAEAVARALEVRLLGARATARREGRTADPEAYDLYLLARRLARDDTPESGRLAAQTFERALAVDPGYAPAWAGLSNAIYWGWADEAGAPEAQEASQARALAAAERAVALAPEGSQGYVARGFLRASLRHDWAGARADLAKALAVSPGLARHHLFHARYLLGPMGLHAEAAAAVARATDLDPLNAKAWAARCELAAAAGRLEEARRAGERSLELAPSQVIAPTCLAAAALVAGRPAEALAAAGRSADPLFRLELEAAALHDLGRRTEARAALDALVRDHAAEAPFQIAAVHAWRGEKDEAFDWLAKAEAVSDPGLTDLKLEPLLRGLRGDPRLAALLGRLSLPPD